MVRSPLIAARATCALKAGVCVRFVLPIVETLEWDHPIATYPVVQFSGSTIGGAGRASLRSFLRGGRVAGHQRLEEPGDPALGLLHLGGRGTRPGDRPQPVVEGPQPRQRLPG